MVIPFIIGTIGYKAYYGARNISGLPILHRRIKIHINQTIRT